MELSKNNTALLLSNEPDDSEVDVIRNVMDLLLHRVRNDISSGRTLINLLGKGILKQEKKEEAIFRINSACQNIHDLCYRCETISSVYSSPVDRERVELKSFLEDTVEDHVARCSNHKINLSVDGDPGMVVDIDKDKAILVVSEIINNACKFCLPGDRLIVKMDQTIENWVISFMDTGAGIPPAFYSDLFRSPLKIIKEEKPCLGFGLLMCRIILAQHNGNIELIRSNGRGTHLRLTIPIQPGGKFDHE